MCVPDSVQNVLKVGRLVLLVIHEHQAVLFVRAVPLRTTVSGKKWVAVSRHDTPHLALIYTRVEKNRQGIVKLHSREWCGNIAHAHWHTHCCGDESNHVLRIRVASSKFADVCAGVVDANNQRPGISISIALIFQD